MASAKITSKQQEILEYIKSEILSKGYPPSVREICEAVNLKSTSSVHSHLESLEKKGYILRERSAEDKRVVRVTLTERGRKAFFHHRDFHKNMIKSIVKGLDEDEKRLLYKCLVKLSLYFSQDEN